MRRGASWLEVLDVATAPGATTRTRNRSRRVHATWEGSGLRFRKERLSGSGVTR